MKTFFTTLVMLAVLLYGCRTTYTGYYTVTSIYKLDGTQTNEKDWLQLDTFNVYSNSCIVSLDNLLITSDGRFAYIESKMYKSNIKSEENSQLEKIIIDYKKKKIFFLNQKKVYNLVANNQFEKLIKTDSVHYEAIVTNNNLNSKICLSKNIPKELKAKFVTNKNKWGVSSIETSQQKIQLNSFQICENCDDFKHLIKKAESVSVKVDKSINLLFPN